MHARPRDRKRACNGSQAASVALEQFVPEELLSLSNPQTDIPRIAKDERLLYLFDNVPFWPH